MRVTLSGELGSGKSSVGRRLAETLKIPHFSAGSLFREIGQISNLDALQTNLAAEDNVAIDHAVDNRTRELDRQHDSFIIDSRMAWHFVSNATKVFLSASPKTAARRIFADQSRSTERYESADVALASLQRRRDSEVNRYKKLYGVDITDPANYDLVIITDDADIADIANLIVLFAAGKAREKFWLPKRRIVPMIDLGAAKGAAAPVRGTSASQATMPLTIDSNFGFFFGEAGQLIAGLGGDLPIVPFLPGRSAKQDVVGLARRTLTLAGLKDWGRALAVELTFGECLRESQAT